MEIVATRCQILRQKSTKFDFRWAYSTPTGPLAEFKGVRERKGRGDGKGRGGMGRGGKGVREREEGRGKGSAGGAFWQIKIYDYTHG